MEIGFANAEERSGVSEDNLTRAAKDGNVEAFGVLFERYKNAVQSFVSRSLSRKEDAEDITMETFCRAWKAMPNFRGESKLISWLFSIAANLCKDNARKAPRTASAVSEMELDIEQLADIVGTHPNIENQSVQKFEIEEALQALCVTYRLLIVMCDIEGFTAAEAASVLGCSITGARVKLFRARKKLRGLLAHLVEGN